jgi:hypothetical protein
MKARKLILSACTAIILAVPSLAQTPPPATARTTASPGTEETLRRIINGFIKGQPDVDEMAPNLANVVKAQSAAMQPVFSKLGALTTLTFKVWDQAVWISMKVILSMARPNGGSLHLTSMAK